MRTARRAEFVPGWPTLAPHALLFGTGAAPAFPFTSPRLRWIYRATNAIYHLFSAMPLRPGDTVLVPDYHSGNEVWAIRAAGARIVFYPINGDRRPDLPALKRLFLKHRPRVLYVMLGETDEWAHGRRYDLYLDAAWRNDRFVQRLWETAQSLPEYSGKTALLVTTDHGRGSTRANWTGHGEKVPESDQIWMAVMGPGVPASGVQLNVMVTQSQVAATIAMLLGEDYNAAQPKAAAPLELK